MAAPTPITRERVFALEAERNGIEGDIRAGLESLGPVGMTAPLVDSEGYPRADVDLFSVRTTRQRVIMLRNDLKAKNTELERALEALHALGPAVFTIPVVPAGSAVGGGSGGPRGAPIAFVDSVSTGSPADSAGLQPGDRILSFGPLHSGSGKAPGEVLPAIGALVGSSENAPIVVTVLRGDAAPPLALTLTPRRWEGRGLLGCHVLPV